MKRTPKKRKYTDEFVKELTEKLLAWIKVEKNLWLGEFAAENGFNRVRLPELAAISDEFKDAYELAKQVQENKLFKIGLSKKFNTSMAIFALKNVAGWRDVQNVELTETRFVEVKNISDEELLKISKNNFLKSLALQKN